MAGRGESNHGMRNTGRRSPKLLTPDPRGAVFRARLGRRLDALLESRLGWIDAPAGSGKTMLLATWIRCRALPALWYRVDGRDADPAAFFDHLARVLPTTEADAARFDALSAEHALALPTFALRWFERFEERLEARTILVLDDYQNLSDDSPLHAMLAAVAGALPQRLVLLISSRRAPPAPFARLRAHGDLDVMGFDELRLTDDEAVELARSSIDESVDEQMVKRLNERAEGWCAGFRLLLEAGDVPDRLDASDPSHRLFFEYFGMEVFGRTPEASRRFMLQTSIVQPVSATLAARLTGRADAGEMLEALVRRGLFTARLHGASFRYHPLFRDFLRARLEAELSEEQRANLHTRAAEELAEAGDVEGAVEMLIRARRFPRAAELAMEQAPTLLASGRHRTLERWLAALPPQMGDESGWILYWKGRAAGARSPVEEAQQLERAYERFHASGDRVGTLLALAGLCESLVLARDSFRPLDRWLAEVERELEEGFPSPELEARCIVAFFAAACHRRPEHPRVAEWERAIRDLLPHVPDPDARAMMTAVLLTHLAWVGDTAAARSILEAWQDAIEPLERCAPRTQILFLLTSALVLWQQGEPEPAVRRVDRALELGRHEGVRANEAIVAEAACWALLAADEPDRAERYLLDHPDPLPGRTANVACRRLLHALVHLRRGELAEAEAELETAERLATEAGATIFDIFVCDTRAHLALARGDRSEVLRHAEQLRALAAPAGYRSHQAEHALLQAVCTDDLERAAEHLREAFALLRELGTIMLPWWSKPQKARLCARALTSGAEVDYARQLVVRQGLRDHPPADADEHWPWPVRVRTFGGLEVEAEGEPIGRGNKAPRRPLELLAALVASEGEASSEQLASMLYPEQEGDAAAAALKTALARLRKLIGHDAIQVRRGVLSLARERVWVDALALTRALDRGDVEANEALDRWYRGPFLPHDDAPWARAARQRLQRRVTRALMSAARERASDDRIDDAISLAERCLEIDPDDEQASRLLAQCNAAGDSAQGRR